MDFFSTHRIVASEDGATQFKRADGIRQDGTMAMYRDVDGRLWCIAGHTNSGHVSMFCGTTESDLSELYPIDLCFGDGHADYAFSGIRYPEGIRARGCIWPFGLYICPGTHRFFCFFHNETAWKGRGSGYDAYGYCQKPAFDSDFRHVGLMHSDDEGRSWVFDRWVLTAETVCFTEAFNPEESGKKGQPMGAISFGSGDFSIYVEPEGEYIYLYYNIIKADTDLRHWTDCDIYVARTRKRDDGVMGDFVKYYDGAFCEAGNFGKETPIVLAGWHPKVVYLKKYGKFLMSSSLARLKPNGGMVNPIMEVRESDDMIHWSAPAVVTRDGAPFGGHYVGFYSPAAEGQPTVIDG
ncbi:MAG: hypothetical protein J6B77_05465, partial [Clostridia bacterium]|nr:hypothetical protein [Clostridia bacterium]